LAKTPNADRYSILSRPDRRFLPVKIILALALSLAAFLTTSAYGAAVTTYSSRTGECFPLPANAWICHLFLFFYSAES
jgi:hypothetical protein